MSSSQITQTISSSSSSNIHSKNNQSGEFSVFLKDVINQLNEDFIRRRRVYDLLILAIGVTIGILLYSLAHDLIIHPNGCALSPEEEDVESSIGGVNTGFSDNVDSEGKFTGKEGTLVDISEKV